MTSLTDDALSHALAGRYDLVREIGRGGMASVYLAAETADRASASLRRRVSS